MERKKAQKKNWAKVSEIEIECVSFASTSKNTCLFWLPVVKVDANMAGTCRTDIHHIVLVSWYSSVWKMKFAKKKICKHNFKAFNDGLIYIPVSESIANGLHRITNEHFFRAWNIRFDVITKTTTVTEQIYKIQFMA